MKLSKAQMAEFNKLVETYGPNETLMAHGIVMKADSNIGELRIGKIKWEGDPYKSKIQDIDYFRFEIEITE